MTHSLGEFISVQAISLPFLVPIYGSRLKSGTLILAKTFLLSPVLCANSSLKSPLQNIREKQVFSKDRVVVLLSNSSRLTLFFLKASTFRNSFHFLSTHAYIKMYLLKCFIPYLRCVVPGLIQTDLISALFTFYLFLDFEIYLGTLSFFTP